MHIREARFSAPRFYLSAVRGHKASIGRCAFRQRQSISAAPRDSSFAELEIFTRRTAR